MTLVLQPPMVWDLQTEKAGCRVWGAVRTSQGRCRFPGEELRAAGLRPGQEVLEKKGDT